MDLTLQEVADLVNGNVIGNPTGRVTGVNGIRDANDGDLTFLGDPRYRPYLESTRAAAVLVNGDVPEANGTPLIQVDNPYAAFARVLALVESEVRHPPKDIHESAVVAKTAAIGQNVALGSHVVIEDGCDIGDDVVIYAGVYVGRGCRIGAGTVIYPRAVIREHVQVGARCIIHSGAVLGSDGFGYTPGKDAAAKIPQVGSVVLEDDVEIGANTTIDRATCGETRIGKSTKIDNLVQIAHNVRIGQACMISGMVGVAGSAIIGDRVTIGGLSGINGHITVGDNVMVAGRSGVTKSVPEGAVVMGFPATPITEQRRIYASQRRLPDMVRRIADLEKRLAQLEAHSHGKTADDS